MSQVVRTTVAALAIAAVLTGCSRTSRVDPIQPADIPTEVKQLSVRTAPPGSSGGNEPSADTEKPRVYWVTAADEGTSLTPVNVDVGNRELSTIDQLRNMMEILTEGAVSSQNEPGFFSYLPPDATLEVASLQNRTAHIRLLLPSAVATKNEPYLIGQIVLSATTIVPEHGNPVRSVLITVNDQERQDVPLPDGLRTTEPLNRLQYQSLIATADPRTTEDEPSGAPVVP